MRSRVIGPILVSVVFAHVSVAELPRLPDPGTTVHTVTAVCGWVGKPVPKVETMARLLRGTVRKNGRQFEIQPRSIFSIVIVKMDPQGLVEGIELKIAKTATLSVEMFQRQLGDYEIPFSTDTTVPWLLSFRTSDEFHKSHCIVDTWLRGDVNVLPKAEVATLYVSADTSPDVAR